MKLSFWTYLCILIFAPLAFASAELWSISVVEILTGISALIFFSCQCYHKQKLVTVPGSTALFLLLLFMVLQLVPLPPSVVQLISPAAYDAYQPVLSLGEESWIPLTINQHRTLQELLRIACYTLFYILTIQLLSIHHHLKKTVYIVTGLAAAIALLAIIQNIESPDKIYWLRSVPKNAQPFGPWVNANQFAGFMEMLCPIALGLFLFFKPRFEPDESLRYRIVTFFTQPSSNLHMILGVAASLIFLSVFITLSRGGIITISLAVFVFIVLYNLKKKRQGQAAIFTVVACALIAVSWFGWDSIASEFNKSIDLDGSITDSRFLIWSDALNIFQSFLPVGSGFGTFIDIFPAYRSFSGSAIIDHAHNDYLELLTDGGVIGFLLAAWFVLSVLLHGWKMIRIRRDKFAVLIGIGALTGVLAMLIHSVTDFNMHNGAVGLYFFFCCGLTVAVTNIRCSSSGTKTLLRKQATGKSIYYLLFGILCSALTLFVQYGALRADACYKKTTHVYLHRLLDPAIINDVRSNYNRAITCDPLNDFHTGNLAAFENVFDNKKEALTLLLRAARQNPMNGVTLQRIAFLLDDEETVEYLLEKSYERQLDNDTLALTFVNHLLQKDKRQKAIGIMADRLQKNSRLLEVYASQFFELYSFTRDEISLVLLDSLDNWFKFGVMLVKNNHLNEADFYFRSALKRLPFEKTVKAQWFQTLIQFYRKNDQPELVLQLLQQATEILPNHISFHLQLGDYYRKEGTTFRAKKAYERVLLLQPKNRAAERRLRQMGLRDSY